MWGTCVWGWRVNMGMDSPEVIELGLKWIITWPNKFVVLVMIEWGQERLWEQRSIGHDCMIEYYGVYYTMSYDKAIAWLYCRRTCNQTLSQKYQYMSTPVQQYCYSVPWYSRHILCSCACVTCATASNLYDVVTIPQWRLCGYHTSHHFPLLRFMHVFIHSVFTAQ